MFIINAANRSLALALWLCARGQEKSVLPAAFFLLDAIFCCSRRTQLSVRKLGTV